MTKENEITIEYIKSIYSTLILLDVNYTICAYSYDDEQIHRSFIQTRKDKDNARYVLIFRYDKFEEIKLDHIVTSYSPIIKNLTVKELHNTSDEILDMILYNQTNLQNKINNLNKQKEIFQCLFDCFHK